MASDKSTDFIKRNRPPRVNISYEDPYDSEKMVELPFVLGVMSDLSGNASEVDKPEMETFRHWLGRQLGEGGVPDQVIGPGTAAP